MASYSTHHRLSSTQFYMEHRKQQAHLKKITEMKRHSGLDNGSPFSLPHIHQTFIKNLNEQNELIAKQNEIKSKKLLNIMTSKRKEQSQPFHPTNSTPRNQPSYFMHSNDDYAERITKTKGRYSAQNWRKQYEQHKGYLKLRKDNRVFTPLDIGINRERATKVNSLANSKITTPTSSTVNVYEKK